MGTPNMNPNIFKNINLFQYVTFESVAAYLDKCQKKQLQVGDILLSPQKYNQNIYILITGKLRIHLNSIDTQPLNVIDIGECVGEMSIIDSLEPSAYVIAEQHSVVLELNQQTLWEMIDGSHTIAKNLLYILSCRVRHGHGVISDGIEVQKKLQHDAMVDGLTGLYNRRWFNEMFKRQFKRCQTDNIALSVILLDIDYFKKVNDQFGHPIGDLVLIKISELLQRCLRSCDTLARFGGEEFIITLPETALPESLIIAERIRVTVSELSIQDNAQEALPTVTVSLGVAQLAEGDNKQSLIKKADDALYQAKDLGRNRVERYRKV